MMNVNKKELKEQEIRTMFITPALKAKGLEVMKNTTLRMVVYLLRVVSIPLQKAKKMIICSVITESVMSSMQRLIRRSAR